MLLLPCDLQYVSIALCYAHVLTMIKCIIKIGVIKMIKLQFWLGRIVHHLPNLHFSYINNFMMVN